MPDETTPAAEAQAAPVTAPAAETAKAPETTPLPAVITDETIREVDADTRDALLFGPTPAAETTEPAKTDEPKAVEEPKVVEEPKTEDAPKVVEDEDFTKNFRLHTDNKQFSAYLKALKAAAEVNPNVNPADVARTVGYDADAIPSAEVTETDATPAQESGDIASARTQLADIEAKLDEAGANEGLVNPEIIGLIKEHGKISAKLGNLELREQLKTERAQEKAHESKVSVREASKAEVLKEYPTAGDDKSTLGKEITLIYNEIMADPNHPDRARLAQDDGPAWITQKAVASKVAELTNLGLTAAQAEAAVRGKPIIEAKGPVTSAPPANTTTTQVKPVPRNTLVTAPGGRSAPETATLTPAKAMEIARNNPKARDEALGFGGNLIIR